MAILERDIMEIFEYLTIKEERLTISCKSLWFLFLIFFPWSQSIFSAVQRLCTLQSQTWTFSLNLMSFFTHPLNQITILQLDRLVPWVSNKSHLILRIQKNLCGIFPPGPPDPQGSGSIHQCSSGWLHILSFFPGHWFLKPRLKQSCPPLPYLWWD